MVNWNNPTRELILSDPLKKCMTMYKDRGSVEILTKPRRWGNINLYGVKREWIWQNTCNNMKRDPPTPPLLSEDKPWGCCGGDIRLRNCVKWETYLWARDKCQNYNPELMISDHGKGWTKVKLWHTTARDRGLTRLTPYIMKATWWICTLIHEKKRTQRHPDLHPGTTD